MPAPDESERRRQRDLAIRTQDQVIAEHLAQAYRSGEIQSAESFGRPMVEPAGWNETPEEFRRPFKILKNAGVMPPELELFQKRGRLREQLAAGCSEPERVELLEQLNEVEQLLALRLEGMRTSGRL